ncbi:hypothetical protein B0H19DRAFT_1276052 [Mycena capillaripes]|nr:hypothetical protein B0H19DRAFT_1276052 [Mycena capillaripes]
MQDMDDLRDALIRNSYYLATAAIQDEVVWRRIGRDNVLVTKDSAVAADAAFAALRDKVEKAHRSENNDKPESEDPSPESLLNPAPLTLVSFISTENCFLASDGHWKGPTEFTANFADVKLACRMAAPEVVPFAADFPRIIKNIQSFMKAAETKGNIKQGIFDPKETPATTLKVRHVLFEARTANSEDEDDFDISNWPVKSEAAKMALNSMTTTHRVTQLPAYDLRGNLIEPSEYVASLRGAIVRATIILKHWNITGKNNEGGRDRYTADIEGLRVLVAPKLQATQTPSPRKRKVPPRDPGMTGSPQKKVHTA